MNLIRHELIDGRWYLIRNSKTNDFCLTKYHDNSEKSGFEDWFSDSPYDEYIMVENPNDLFRMCMTKTNKLNTIEEIILEVIDFDETIVTKEIYTKALKIKPDLKQASLNAALARLSNPRLPEYMLKRLKKGHYFRPANKTESVK